MNLEKRVAALSDQEAEEVLNRVLVGLDLTQPDFHAILTDKSHSLEVVITKIAEAADSPSHTISEQAISDRGDVVRAVLAEMSRGDRLRPNVEAALATNRPILFDPVTASLVLAGIVAVLSTEVKISYKDGKLEVAIHKKATTEKLLGKFFQLFK